MKLFIQMLNVISFVVPVAFASASSYDTDVLRDRPVAYLAISGSRHAEIDLTRRGHNGFYLPAGRGPVVVRMPNGDPAAQFNGLNQYLEIADSDELSIPRTGVLTIEAWIRPSVLQFPRPQGSGYVYWLGKGGDRQNEYAGRMYSMTNQENPPRPNRISAYAFNLDGGLGSGSYFQDPVVSGEWIHVAMVFITRARSAAYPTGYVKIFKDGVLRKTTALSQFGVTPHQGTQPLRVATMDMNSFFDGAIGKLAVYNYELTPDRMASHFRGMRR